MVLDNCCLPEAPAVHTLRNIVRGDRRAMSNAATWATNDNDITVV
jgi:hypothetical protein